MKQMIPSVDLVTVEQLTSNNRFAPLAVGHQSDAMEHGGLPFSRKQTGGEHLQWISRAIGAIVRAIARDKACSSRTATDHSNPFGSSNELDWASGAQMCYRYN
jgi:hypothetical protein